MAKKTKQKSTPRQHHNAWIAIVKSLSVDLHPKNDRAELFASAQRMISLS